jgi:hypothetical protein
MAIASGLHIVAQIENRTTASATTLRMTVAIPAASMMSARLDAMRHSWRQSSGGVDLDHGSRRRWFYRSM